MYIFFIFNFLGHFNKLKLSKKFNNTPNSKHPLRYKLYKHIDVILKVPKLILKKVIIINNFWIINKELL